MLIDATIRTRKSPKDKNGVTVEAKQKWDVITVKPAGSPQGSECPKVHQIVELDTDDFRADFPEVADKIEREFAAGSNVIANPFEVIDETIGETLQRSALFIDLDNHSKRPDIENPAKEHPKMLRGEVVSRIKKRTTPTR